MTLPTSHPPNPQAQRAPHPFQTYAQLMTEMPVIGLKADDDPPMHLPAAQALEGVLDGLAGRSDHAGSDKPFPFTVVAKALQAPPHGHSERAIADLKLLLQKFMRTHGRPATGPGRQRRYMPLASDEWMLTAAPHYAFQRINEAQRLEAAAQAERLARLSQPARRRHHVGAIRLPASHRGIIVP